MAIEPLTPTVSTRICKHMNDDHPDALLEFAKFFGGIIKPNKAKLIELTSLAMQLEVDGKPIEIAFDHKVMDSEDAHRTLVAMLRKAKEVS